MNNTAVHVAAHDYQPGRGGYCTVCGQSRNGEGHSLQAAELGVPTRFRDQQTQPLIAMISVDKIEAHPRNIRQDLGALRKLSASLAAEGVLQPLLLHRTRPGLQIVDGHRRWAAAKLAGVKKVPAYIVDQLADDQVISKAIATGVTNRSLHQEELRAALRTLMHEFGHTASDLADRFGMSKRKVYSLTADPNSQAKAHAKRNAKVAARIKPEQVRDVLSRWEFARHTGLTPVDAARLLDELEQLLPVVAGEQ